MTGYEEALGFSQVFSFSGSVSTGVGVFETVGGAAGQINLLAITLSGEEVVLDNIVLGTSVPEPATWFMMLVGLAFVGGAMRMKLRSKAVA